MRVARYEVRVVCHRSTGKKGKAAAPASAGKGGGKGASKTAAAAQLKGGKGKAAASIGKGAAAKGGDKPGKKILAEPVQEIATERALEIAKESQRVLDRAKTLRVRSSE